MKVDETTRDYVRTVIDEVPYRSGDLVGVVARGGRRRWGHITVSAIGATVVLALLLTPVVMRSPEDQNLASAADRAPTFEKFLADGWVTEEEYLAAGAAVVQCVENQGFTAHFSPNEMSFGTRYPDGQSPETRHPAATALRECMASGITPIMVAWSTQVYNPEADFEIFTAAIECTETQTGIDYGEMTKTPDGVASDESLQTLQRAMEQAPHVYPECMRDAKAR